MKKVSPMNEFIAYSFAIAGAILGFIIGSMLIEASTEVRTEDLLLAYVGLPATGMYVIGFIGVIVGQKVQDNHDRY